MGRSYQQFCPLACALDVVGDRWTALLLRDLAFGPRRFGELQRSLDGIGPNLLTTRLDQLRSAGLVERRPVEGAKHHVYARTELGHAADEFLVPLSRWGVPLLADADLGRADPAMAPIALRSLVRWEELDDDGVTVRLDLDVGTYEIVITDAGEAGRRRRFSERIATRHLTGTGDDIAADVVMRGSIFSLLGDALEADFEFEGDARDIVRVQLMLGIAQAAPA